jgi:hypothetical protein
MSEIRISKVSPLRNGVDGMKVVFSRVEAGGDGMKYNNEYTATYKMPVSAGLRDCWNRLKGHVIRVLGLDEELNEEDIRVLSVGCDSADVIRMQVNVKAITGKWYNVNMPPVCNSEEYSQYDRMVELIDDLWLMTSKYVVGEAIAEKKQYVLDLYQENEVKGKKQSLTMDEIEGMDENEVMKFYADYLEAKGAVFLERPDEALVN